MNVTGRLTDAITSRFFFLASFPMLDESAMKISVPGLRVVHGRRDLEALFGK